MRRLTFVGLLMCLTVLLLTARAQDEQAEWESLNIESYHIAVQRASAWNVLQVEVWVQDNQVKLLQAGCEPGFIGLACHVDSINPRDYLVGELFNQVEGVGEILARVEYDPTYHFPMLITVNDPDLIDEEYAIRVTAFEVLVDNEPGTFVTEMPQITTTTPVKIVPLTLNPAAPNGDLADWIDEAEARWDAQEIDAYQLTLVETNPWNGMDITLEVQGGYVKTLEVTCHPGWMGGPCEVWTIDAQRYTVPGLLEQLREAATGEHRDMLAIDAETGIPIRLFYDDPEVFDEEWEIVVSRVTLLGDETVR
jgi:hypothetical protein